jgi:hypothetical protein
MWTDEMLNTITISAVAPRDLKIRQVLLSCLPTGDKLASALRQNNVVWQVVRSRYITPDKDWGSLEQFAAHAFSHGSPLDIAQIIQSFVMGGDDKFYERTSFMLEHFIFSDDRYMNTIEGLHAEIIGGVLHGEKGQNKRCWSTWRKALEHAQALGLHKTRMTNDAELVWHAIYNFDRFQSMLVGRPHGIQDAHCKPSELNFRPGAGGVDLMDFVIFELGKIAGKISDHVQKFNGPDPPSPYELVELNQELAHFLFKLPEDFWQVESNMPSTDIMKNGAWRSKILSQLTYYQTCVSLHLPYMLQSFKNPQYEYLRDRCIQDCRNFAFIYNQFRNPSNPLPVKPRTFDSVGCAATLVLLFGITSDGQVHKAWEQGGVDIGLVESLVEVLGRVAEETNDRSARESFDLINRFRDRDATATTAQRIHQGPFELLTSVDGVEDFLATLKKMGDSNQMPSVTNLAGEVRSWLETMEANSQQTTPIAPSERLFGHPSSATPIQSLIQTSHGGVLGNLGGRTPLSSQGPGTCVSEYTPSPLASDLPIESSWLNVQYGTQMPYY